MIVIIAIITMDWHYGYDDQGNLMRCWSVWLPGTQEYTDFDADPFRIYGTFSMRVRYRIGPWIKPEWEGATTNDWTVGPNQSPIDHNVPE